MTFTMCHKAWGITPPVPHDFLEGQGEITPCPTSVPKCLQFKKEYMVLQVGEIIRRIMPAANEEGLSSLFDSIACIDTWLPGERINSSGNKESYIRFLVKGVVRGYVIDENDREITVWYANKPGHVLADFNIIGDVGSEMFLTAVSESEVLSIPVNRLMALQANYPSIGALYFQYLSQYLHCLWNMEKMLYLKSAKERYEWFLQEYPGLINEVNNAQIASFLNITPVTLSRIRHET